MQSSDQNGELANAAAASMPAQDQRGRNMPAIHFEKVAPSYQRESFGMVINGNQAVETFGKGS